MQVSTDSDGVRVACFQDAGAIMEKQWHGVHRSKVLTATFEGTRFRRAPHLNRKVYLSVGGVLGLNNNRHTLDHTGFAARPTGGLLDDVGELVREQSAP